MTKTNWTRILADWAEYMDNYNREVVHSLGIDDPAEWILSYIAHRGREMAIEELAMVYGHGTDENRAVCQLWDNN